MFVLFRLVVGIMMVLSIFVVCVFVCRVVSNCVLWLFNLGFVVGRERCNFVSVFGRKIIFFDVGLFRI